MATTPKVTAKTNSGLVHDYGPSDLAQKSQMEGPAAYGPHEQGELKDAQKAQWKQQESRTEAEKSLKLANGDTLKDKPDA